MSSDAMASGAPEDDRPQHQPQARAPETGGGFFHIYKRGQGYWTRVGTAAAAALLAILCLQFLYARLNVWLYPLFAPSDATLATLTGDARTAALAHAQSTTKGTTIAVCGGFLAAYSLLVWYMMNKPSYADFLIATDSEMKKVNWTSRKELMGSTKVVILFMFLIAFMLFGYDVIFGYLFYFMNVLKSRPF